MTTKIEKCQRKKVKTVMEEYKEGSLKRRNGKAVKSQKEAVAIALNVAKKKCKCKTKTCKH
jgi:hypothetical protein